MKAKVAVISSHPVIMWFTRDLRVHDNRALHAAIASGAPVVPVYVLDESAPIGGAQRWWLHHSLSALGDTLSSIGLKLILRRGDTNTILRGLISETDAQGLHCARTYEPAAQKLEQDIKQLCTEVDVKCHRYAGQLLFEPERVHTPGGTPYKVYTPFSKRCFGLQEPKPPMPAPKQTNGFDGAITSDNLSDWYLPPTSPDWAAGFSDHWVPGESGARNRLADFLDEKLRDYSNDRDIPSIEGTSRLSPHLHFGEISPAQCWHAAKHALAAQTGCDDIANNKFVKELLWREFATHLLFHFPDMPDTALKSEYEKFPWLNNETHFTAWTRGMTGFPIVDAGMRELWQTGWMHNRVRMIVASFLIKNLLIDWRKGANWFEDTLVDADLASNSASWQWVAGSGADAAPFFRIFNPMRQGERFDPDGAYVRRFVPEIANLPDKFIHRPWEAPAEVLEAAQIELGTTYPAPLVDHFTTRDRALAALKTISKSAKARKTA